MKNRIADILKMLLFLGVGVIILYFLYQSLDASYQEECAQRGIASSDCNLWQKLVNDLKSTNVFWLVVIAICFFISNISRALRWQQLIQTFGHSTRRMNAFLTTMLGYFANLGFPRVGEFVRAGSFARYEKIPFENIMGTVAVDRTVDLLCFVIIFTLGMTLQFDVLWTYFNENLSLPFTSIFQSVWFYFGAAIVLLSLVLIYLRWQALQRYGLFARLNKLIGGFIEGLKSIAKVKSVGWFIAHTLIIWLMYYLMTYLCFKSFEPTAALGPLAGMMVFVFGTIGMIIPSPGGMGSYHALVIAGLVLYGVRADDAFSFAMIIFFTINIFGNILFGLLALLILPGYNSQYQPVRA